MLPANLHAAELDMFVALKRALINQNTGRWAIELRFEGLRLLPLGLRLLDRLRQYYPEASLLFPDAGATALAKRDAPNLADSIRSLSDQRRRQQKEGATDGILLLAKATPSVYDIVESLSLDHRGALVLLNGNLEDAAVGIGSVARKRRRGFMATWQEAYVLIPQAFSALRLAYPSPWELYRLDPDGYRLANIFEQKPNAESQLQALKPGATQGLGNTLQAIDDLIEDLR